MNGDPTASETPKSVMEDRMDDIVRMNAADAGDVSDYCQSLVLLGDSLGRPLTERIRLLMERANREARLAVALRLKLEEVAGPEVASSVNVE
jgi:hypothetical protein